VFKFILYLSILSFFCHVADQVRNDGHEYSRIFWFARDVGCGTVRCEMWDVRCEMWDTRLWDISGIQLFSQSC